MADKENIDIDLNLEDNDLQIKTKNDKKTTLLSFVVICILGLGGYSAYVTNDLSLTKNNLSSLDKETKSLRDSYEKIDLDKYLTKEETSKKQKEIDNTINTTNTDIKALQDKQSNDVKELRSYIDSKFDNLSNLIKQSNEAKIEAKKVVDAKPKVKEVKEIKENNSNDNTIEENDNETNTYICFDTDKDYCKAFALENKAEYFKMGKETFKTLESNVYECNMHTQDKPSCNYQAYLNKKPKFKIGKETYRVIDHNTYRLLKQN